MSRIRLRLTEEGEGDDPLLSLVNLIDVFLVLVAALLLTLARTPSAGPGARPLPESPKVERFQGEGAATTAEGGVRAGTAYRLPDGSLVVVPE
ncbi:MAG: hypothetical protein PHI64_07665 [Zoogloea sp.]|uniref:hypothetical protein n=1 Tax=Zoogloea sp. TaxID=49181 RepID=UPI002629301F|nr:hypothetical protein [Zoogloea sp.]MDD2988824.1 hypothetical protein [Zoogloea sp.]